MDAAAAARLCAEHAEEAIRRQIELTGSKNPKVANAALAAILNRFGPDLLKALAAHDSVSALTDGTPHQSVCYINSKAP
jgi:hypothetical protein